MVQEVAAAVVAKATAVVLPTGHLQAPMVAVVDTAMDVSIQPGQLDLFQFCAQLSCPVCHAVRYSCHSTCLHCCVLECTQDYCCGSHKCVKLVVAGRL